MFANPIRKQFYGTGTEGIRETEKIKRFSEAIEQRLNISSTRSIAGTYFIGPQEDNLQIVIDAADSQPLGVLKISGTREIIQSKIISRDSFVLEEKYEFHDMRVVFIPAENKTWWNGTFVLYTP